MTKQTELAQKLKALYSDVLIKKIDKDNYLDIHLPDVNKNKGTHLFFNTSKGKIKLGFYCREEDFVQRALSRTELLEKYSQGLRLKDNPVFEKVDAAIQAAQTLIEAISAKRVAAPDDAEVAVMEKVDEKEQNTDNYEDDNPRGCPIFVNAKDSGMPSEQSIGEVLSFEDFKNLINDSKSGTIDLREAYLQLSEPLKRDTEIMAFMLSSTLVFDLFPIDIRRDKEFIMNWFETVKNNLINAEANLKVNPDNLTCKEEYEVANSAAAYAPHILADMDDSLVNDDEILNAALTSKYVSFIEKLNPEKWGIDKDWAIKAAKINIHSVYYLPKVLKNDEEVCKALLDVHLSAFNFFEEEMKRNDSIQECALSKDGYVFAIFPEDLKGDKQFIKSMLENCYDADDQRGYMVLSAAEPLNIDMELIDLAIERNVEIFRHLYPKDRYSMELFEHFLKVTPNVYQFVPENLKDNRDLMISLLSGGFDSYKRESIFKNSKWYDDFNFGLDLVQASDYSYSYGYLKEDLKSHLEILNSFMKKFPDPKNIAQLPARKIGLDWFRPLVKNNMEVLYYINDKNITDILLPEYKEHVLHKVKNTDLKFFDSMGLSLKGNSEVFRAFMNNPLIESRFIEQPGFYIEQDELLMKEVELLLGHLEHSFFNDRFNTGLDRKGVSFEQKCEERLAYTKTLSAENTNILKLLLSDPCAEIREESAKRIKLDLKDLDDIIETGIPIVIHYEWGKSLIENKKDHYVLKGLLSNSIMETASAKDKDRLEKLIHNTRPELMHVKVVLRGKGSEFIQGFISQEEYKLYKEFKSKDSYFDDSDAWIAYLEYLADSEKPPQKEAYYDYNEISHFTGINLEDLIIEVYNLKDENVMTMDYEKFNDEYEDSLEENSFNDYETYGKYVNPKKTGCLVTYKSTESFKFSYTIPNIVDFNPLKLRLKIVSTDGMGYGVDYGDFCLGIIYDGITYDDNDQSSFGGNVSVYFDC